MADSVRYIMEEMLPELEDFQKKGYFTRDEIKQIVKQRENFEYLLKRKAPVKRDFHR
jgi:U3 small nucleolar RNA-associated protein 6